jgi:hypothetical protein
MLSTVMHGFRARTRAPIHDKDEEIFLAYSCIAGETVYN